MVNATPRKLCPRERPGIHCIGGWVGRRTGLDGCGKSRPRRDSIPGPSSPLRVALPTKLTRPHCIKKNAYFSKPYYRTLRTPYELELALHHLILTHCSECATSERHPMPQLDPRKWINWLTFRHRASCILGQAFHYSPENAFYIFNQQIYFII